MKNRIKEFRQMAGLSQREMARQLNINYTSVCLWETGGTEPTTANAIAIAKLLGTSVETLFPSDIHTDRIPAQKMSKLEQRRRIAGASLRLVSEASGVGISSLFAYEKGTHPPGLFNAMLLASVFDTTVEELFGP